MRETRALYGQLLVVVNYANKRVKVYIWRGEYRRLRQKQLLHHLVAGTHATGVGDNTRIYFILFYFLNSSLDFYGGLLTLG